MKRESNIFEKVWGLERFEGINHQGVENRVGKYYWKLEVMNILIAWLGVGS